MLGVGEGEAEADGEMEANGLTVGLGEGSMLDSGLGDGFTVDGFLVPKKYAPAPTSINIITAIIILGINLLFLLRIQMSTFHINERKDISRNKKISGLYCCSTLFKFHFY